MYKQISIVCPITKNRASQEPKPRQWGDSLKIKILSFITDPKSTLLVWPIINILQKTEVLTQGLQPTVVRST